MTMILKSETTGENFAAQSVCGSYLLSGPIGYREVASIVEGERVGETATIDGETVDAIPSGLVRATDSFVERCITEAHVQGVKLGDGWL